MARYQIVIPHGTDEELARYLEQWSEHGFNVVAATPSYLVLRKTDWPWWLPWVATLAVVAALIVVAGWVAAHGH